MWRDFARHFVRAVLVTPLVLPGYWPLRTSGVFFIFFHYSISSATKSFCHGSVELCHAEINHKVFPDKYPFISQISCLHQVYALVIDCSFSGYKMLWSVHALLSCIGGRISAAVFATTMGSILIRYHLTLPPLDARLSEINRAFGVGEFEGLLAQPSI